MVFKNKLIVLNSVYLVLSSLCIFIGFAINEEGTIGWGIGALMITLGNLVVVLSEDRE